MKIGDRNQKCFIHWTEAKTEISHGLNKILCCIKSQLGLFLLLGLCMSSKHYFMLEFCHKGAKSHQNFHNVYFIVLSDWNWIFFYIKNRFINLVFGFYFHFAIMNISSSILLKCTAMLSGIKLLEVTSTSNCARNNFYFRIIMGNNISNFNKIMFYKILLFSFSLLIYYSLFYYCFNCYLYNQ